MPEDRVLIATDLSKAAEAVLRTGLTLAQRLGAETLVLLGSYLDKTAGN